MSRASNKNDLDKALQGIRSRLQRDRRERWPRATPWEAEVDDEPTRRVIHTIFIGAHAPNAGI
ncbi:MAG: hypothetical protein KJO07_02870 [Deltaproteobacteria bacterium]|jgi:hypothetical protein|nr:hypothetical protein [Deltaproteobacteria bacterium]